MMELPELKPRDWHWGAGWTKCAICGRLDVTVIEIPKEFSLPIVAMECADCHNMTVHPVDDDHVFS